MRLPRAAEELIDDLARVIHDTDDDREGAFPDHDEDDGQRSPGGYIRLVSRDVVEMRRAQARAVLSYLLKRAA